MLYRPTTTSAATAVRYVTGQFLAKNRLCKRDRAKLAADILARKAVVIDLTAKQVAGLCRVSSPYIAEARGRSPAATRLLRDWNAADPDQRIQFIRRADPERVFDAIARAIG
jgi:hypothetical protein